MKKFYLLIFLTCISYGQVPVDSVLNFTLSYRGLTRNDITIPVDYFNAGEKSPTNGTQLILPLVRDMLNNPLRSMGWMDSVMAWKDDKPYNILGNILYILLNEKFTFSNDKRVILRNNINSIHHKIIKMDFDKSYILEVYNDNEKNYLKENLWSIFEEETSDDLTNTDIFKFNVSRDSSISKSKKVIQLLSKLNLRTILLNSLSDFFFFYYLYLNYNSFEKDLNSKKPIVIIDTKSKILINVGTEDNDYSSKHYQQFEVIIDEGGNDRYSTNSNLKCIIDLSGNDYYTTKSDFALGGGLFSSSFIFDKSGDDTYDSKGSGNLGAAIGGLGLIYDEAGNDTYKSISFSIGAGCFGVGLIVDREGNDFYIANSYSQGFGMTQGVGCIVDNKGNDSYLVDSRSLDIGRYNDHYVSMCQGFGLGLRPYYAGGIGLIIEGEGNDIYNTDIFGQGGGYWYGLGVILDKSGHDKYNGYQYSQGSGIHIAVGLLKDYDGWDFYNSNGVSQGCGHDFGFGTLHDVKGNDNYSAYSLSQGAGNANGIGLLIDESGRDGYLNKEPGNTRGYGNPRREYGSLGIFLDASGDDFYSVAGLDSTVNNSSQWGVSNDYFLADLPEQISGDNFKVETKTEKIYSTEEYFTMAKTIEPRFSKWSELGFAQLVADSFNTSNYILSQLKTDDHRVTQVLRVLILKIPYAISDALKKQLLLYKNKQIELQPNELSMMCFLMGESKNEIFKDDLLDLTYNENVRVKSTSVNALGKIKYDTTDAAFVEKVAKRFYELYKDNSQHKILSKDLAFASKNYKSVITLQVLGGLLTNDYYGARFMAANGFKIFDDFMTSGFLMGFINPFGIDDRTYIHSILMVVQNLGDESFKSVLEFLLKRGISDDEIIRLNIVEILKSKKTSDKNEFQSWLDVKINELQSGLNLKVR